MMDADESPQRVGAPDGLGGPGMSLPVDPVIAPFLASEVCECREAQLLRMLADGTLPLPMTGSFKTLAGVVRAAAIRKLRALSHDISEGGRGGGASWASGTSYAALEDRRNHYDRPGRTPEQIRAEVEYSWRKVEREIGAQSREAS